MDRVKALAEVLESYATTDEQHKVLKHFTSKTETNEKEQVIELVAALYDGLAYGNWPWRWKAGRIVD